MADRDYLPEVVQVIPREGQRVLVYFDDGKIVEKDMGSLLADSGGTVFQPLNDPDVFAKACCVMNGTLAWDPSGRRDSNDVIDLDPLALHDLPAVNPRWANE